MVLILRLIGLIGLLIGMALCLPVSAQARQLQLRVDTLHAEGVSLEGVQVQLHWPKAARSGQLRLRAQRLRSSEYPIDWQQLDWQCPLQRRGNGWQCAGVVRAAGLSPAQLHVNWQDAQLAARLQQGRAQLAFDYESAEAMTVLLSDVPVQWLQAIAKIAWQEAQLLQGQVSGRVQLALPQAAPMQATAHLQLNAVDMQNADASIATAQLNAQLRARYVGGAAAQLQLAGQMQGGELLFGQHYIALPATPVQWALTAQQVGETWQLPRLFWHDADVLQLHGQAQLAADGALDALTLTLRSADSQPLPQRYLSGPLGVLGLDALQLAGAVQARVHLQGADVQQFSAQLQQLHITDSKARFGFDGINGTLAYSAHNAVQSQLSWQQGQLYGLQFGTAALPFFSENGRLTLRHAVAVPLFGGQLQLHQFQLVPPQAGQTLQATLAMALNDVDMSGISEALGLPAFTGKINGHLPSARYADDVLEFDGGLSLAVFDGAVQFSQLRLERPFGTAPSLSVDIDLQQLDLQALTGVLDIGEISGRLDGAIHGLRLLNWSPIAFDARLYTVPRKGVRQRISQRAVQDISSVGDASLMTSLQGQLIGFFDDFGYNRIAIGCKLERQICRMSGLHSESNRFTIVEGAGLPRLNVVGYHQNVDWDVLLERLLALGNGQTQAVIE